MAVAIAIVVVCGFVLVSIFTQIPRETISEE